ncbi:MAG TPA: four helix bundle protein [Acidobacteriota bacterium]|jgi:four helix bundle protein|nr:four helix bundle protein [Acidobacteriota bacterium]HNR40266.1 four helix bundle protein [Acidobacteriota bacterium]HNU02215.1 four helix bundle protein [Acidobacteriota bacterium]
MVFDHEKLDVYQASLDFVKLTSTLLDNSNPSIRHIRDQLGRAALSIPLNIAEGNGKRSPRERRRFFEIARGSAMECAARLDILASLAGGLAAEVNDGNGLLSRIVAMLTRMTMPRRRLVQEDRHPANDPFNGQTR